PQEDRRPWAGIVDYRRRRRRVVVTLDVRAIRRRVVHWRRVMVVVAVVVVMVVVTVAVIARIATIEAEAEAVGHRRAGADGQTNRQGGDDCKGSHVSLRGRRAWRR